MLRVLPLCGSGPGSVLAWFSLWMPLGLWHHPMVSSRNGDSSYLDSLASWELQLHQFCIFKANGDATS